MYANIVYKSNKILVRFQHLESLSLLVKRTNSVFKILIQTGTTNRMKAA